MTTERFRIVVPDWLVPPADVEEAVFGDRAEIRLLGATDAADIRDELRDADAVLLWHEVSLGAADIEAMERCRVIVRYGVGFDSVDLAAAAKKGIPVCHVPDYGTEEVADHAMALLLALARGIVVRHEEVVSGTWDVGVSNPPLRRLRGTTLGILGLGRIGTATALRAKAFGMEVVFYDPYVPDGRDKSLGVRRVESLKELAAASDALSIHVPLTDETRRMVGEEFFRDAKDGVVVVNTARGEVVVADAFAKALADGKAAAGGFDVLPVEPPDSTITFLTALRHREEFTRGRLVFTPHSAFYTEESLRELREKTAREALRVLCGKPPRNCVNADLLGG
jgi:D-3-phosphoglycerate dehydrogenase/C-terminal binding protein